MPSFIESYAPSLQEMDEQRAHQGQMPFVVPEMPDELLLPADADRIHQEGRNAFATHYAETGSIRNPPTNPYGDNYTSRPINTLHGFPQQTMRVKRMRAWVWYDAYGTAESEHVSGVNR